MAINTEPVSIESNMGIAICLASTYARRSQRLSREDLVQEAFLALCKSAKAYEKTEHHNAKFSTYAWQAIMYHLEGVCQKELNRLPTVSLIREDAGSQNHWSWIDIPVESPERTYLQRIQDETVRRTLYRVSRRLRSNARRGTECFLRQIEGYKWNEMNMDHYKYTRCLQAAREDLKSSEEIRRLFHKQIA